jgi:mannose/fructose/N-acetylgalactosamine-specific phosphotransferase system component IIC
MEATVVAVVVAVVVGFIHHFRRAGQTRAIQQAEAAGETEIAEQTRAIRRTESLVALSLMGVLIVLAFIALIASLR